MDIAHRDGFLVFGVAKGAAGGRAQPRAVDAYYDKTLRRVVVMLSNGCGLMVPPHLVRGLHVGGYEELGRVEIVGEGEALRWQALGTELSVAGVLGALFGPRAHAARHAGRATSAAKAAAARANGAKGGRPRKVV